MLSCHSGANKLLGDTDYVFALAGNPNVGKSSIFNQLTGMGVITANYPGKTVELNIGTTEFRGQRIGIIDLPGSYAIGAISEDQWVARQAVLESKPDVVIMIVDATNLARNLYMVLQFLELELPVIVALNLIDVAEEKKIHTDTHALEEMLGVPVVPTVAISGKGMDEMMAAAVELARGGHRIVEKTHFGEDIEKAIANLAARLPQTYLPNRALAILLLEGDSQFMELVGSMPDGKNLLAEAAKAADDIEKRHGEPAGIRIARERYGLAGTITQKVQERGVRVPPLSERLWRHTTSPVTGLPILGIVLALTFTVLFIGGDALSVLLSNAWASLVSPRITYVLHFLFGDGELTGILRWGFDAGILAALAVGIPYVLTFYFMLAILEDTGYLNSAAFLMDRVMHKFGMHGRSIIPIIAGAGCNVPAIIGTRVLTTLRERIIASTLIVLVPCSARTAVILGAVSLFLGWQAAVVLYGIVLVVIVAVGLILNRMMPGEPSGLVMEMFPFRKPMLRGVLKKTWLRFRAFIAVAFPIVFVGSIALGALYETGYLWKLSAPLSPVIEGWLGLPAVAGLTLVIAVLRKELALQLLTALAVIQYGGGAENLLMFMSREQIFVYTLVNTLYIPCIATIGVLVRELGWRRALLISVSTVSLAIIIGGLVHRVIIAGVL